MMMMKSIVFVFVKIILKFNVCLCYNRKLWSVGKFCSKFFRLISFFSNSVINHFFGPVRKPVLRSDTYIGRDELTIL